MVKEKKPKGKVISSFEDWKTADEYDVEYCKLADGALLPFCRLSGAEIQKINRECEEPIPTSINPAWTTLPKDPYSNMPIPGQLVPDYNKPEYKKYAEGLRLDDKRITLYIDLALKKASVKLNTPKLIIPGNTWEEKYEALSKRLLNEVGLINAKGLFGEILNLSAVSSQRIDFFLEDSVPSIS